MVVRVQQIFLLLIVSFLFHWNQSHYALAVLSCSKLLKPGANSILNGYPHVLLDRKKEYVYKALDGTSEQKSLEFADWLFSKFNAKFLRANTAVSLVSRDDFFTSIPDNSLPWSFRKEASGANVIIKYRNIKGYKLLRSGLNRYPQHLHKMIIETVRLNYNEAESIFNWVRSNPIFYEGAKIKTEVWLDADLLTVHRHRSERFESVFGSGRIFVFSAGHLHFLVAFDDNMIFDLENGKATIVDPY